MKIAIVGYGKMGHMIESCAKAGGHDVVATVDVAARDATNLVAAGDYKAVAAAVKASGAEGVIEFSHPSAVMGNLNQLILKVANESLVQIPACKDDSSFPVILLFT